MSVSGVTMKHTSGPAGACIYCIYVYLCCFFSERSALTNPQCELNMKMMNAGGYYLPFRLLPDIPSDKTPAKKVYNILYNIGAQTMRYSSQRLFIPGGGMNKLRLTTRAAIGRRYKYYIHIQQLPNISINLTFYNF